MKTAPSIWIDRFIALAEATPPMTIEDVVLPDTHPAVQHAMAEWSDAAMRRREKAWDRCRILHDKVREGLTRAGYGPVPSVDEMRQQLGDVEWKVWLTNREVDLYMLNLFVARKVLKLEPTHYAYIWNLTNNIYFANPKDASMVGLTGCFLTHHKHMLVNKGRPITGLEQLFAQGYPEDIKLGLDHQCETPMADHELKHLAGDTMTVPVMGGLLLVALTHIRFLEEGVKVSVKKARQVKSEMFDPVKPCWVGPSKWLEKSTRADNLASYLPEGFLERFHAQRRRRL